MNLIALELYTTLISQSTNIYYLCPPMDMKWHHVAREMSNMLDLKYKYAIMFLVPGNKCKPST